MQIGAVPVFIDVELGTYVPTLDAIAAAIGPKTRGVMIAHTMGNPFDAAAVAELCRERGLWLIEDCCDALGTQLQGRHGRHLRRSGHALASIRPTTSPSAKAAPWRPTIRSSPGWPARSAIGAATAIAAAATTTPAATLQPAIRHAALRLRSQVRLFAHRLQPEGDRHPSGHRLRADEEAAGVHRRTAAELDAAARDARSAGRSA